jgi:hypothetical protein
MNFSIVFNQTGDVIPFQTVSNAAAEVLCYYVENLNQQQLNNFVATGDYGSTLDLRIKNLHSLLEECNHWMEQVTDQLLPTHELSDYLEQQNLNSLHVLWVKLQNKQYVIQERCKKYNSPLTNKIQELFPDEIPVTTVNNILHKLNLHKTFDQINVDIHNLEDSFKRIIFGVKNKFWVEMPNHFPKDIITNNISNFLLTCNHLGRILPNKFENYDIDLSYDDENSYNELLGLVTVRLSRPETIPYSPEYVEWCTKHNRTPIGGCLNIGNIPDLVKNLTKYRKIIFKNTLQNNTFSIQLH